jgi:hypothetical protein
VQSLHFFDEISKGSVITHTYRSYAENATRTHLQVTTEAVTISRPPLQGAGYSAEKDPNGILLRDVSMRGYNMEGENYKEPRGDIDAGLLQLIIRWYMMKNGCPLCCKEQGESSVVGVTVTPASHVIWVVFLLVFCQPFLLVCSEKGSVKRARSGNDCPCQWRTNDAHHHGCCLSQHMDHV